MLANRSLPLGVQGIAYIARPVLVLNYHLVTALTAVGQALQQGCPLPRNSTRLVPVVFGVIVSESRLNPFIRLPGDIARITVMHDDTPFAETATLLSGAHLPILDRAYRSGPAISEGTGIGRIP